MAEASRQHTVRVPTLELIDLHRKLDDIQRTIRSMLEPVSLRELEEVVQKHRALQWSEEGR